MKQHGSTTTSGRKTYLIGYHPSRSPFEKVYSPDGRAEYPANTTRTVEECDFYKNEYGYRTNESVQALPMTCNGLDGTSGAGIFLKNEKTNDLELVGIYKHDGTTGKFNYGVSLPPSKLDNVTVYSDSQMSYQY